MEETKKTRIVPLDDKPEFALWRFCARVAISPRKLSTLFTRLDYEDGSMVEKMEEASNIIVFTRSDHVCRAVRSLIGDSAAMMAKLDDCYDSKTTASKSTVMVELIFLRYSSLKKSMARHLDRIAALVE